MDVNDAKEPTESEVKGGKVVESTKPAGEKIKDSKQFKIKRGRLKSMTIYDVSEGEIEKLEKGRGDSLYLNISLTLLSSALSFLTSLLTTDFTGRLITQIVFIIITIIGFVGGIIMGVIWLNVKNEYSETIKHIKSRMKE